MQDLLSMQRCNLLCLPENYQLKVKRRRLDLDAVKKKKPSPMFFLENSTRPLFDLFL